LTILWILMATNLIAAMGTACHSVMYKRDPRAAWGWVMTSFAMPFLGPLLYWFLGVNRIRRRRIGELPGIGPPAGPAQKEVAEVEARLLEVNAPQFTDLVHLSRRVTDQPLLAGNLVEPLRNGEEAYAAMLRAIEGARRSVNLATYIFDGDVVGREFARVLSVAAERGVEVHVIVDAFGERYSKVPARHLFWKSKVKCARFVPPIPLWRGAFLNLRSHRKILVVDGMVGFTGGMNLSERHLTARVGNPHRVEDLHFRIRGPIVAELQRVFIDDWWFVTGEKLQGDQFHPPLDYAGTALCRGVSDGPNQDQEKLRYIILGAIACARHRIQIQTPYFIPDRVILAGLVTAALRGVEVDILLPARSNLPFFDWAMTAYLWELLRFGIRVFLVPAPFVHTKVLLVDGIWILIGSANLDPRSLRLNFEFNVEVYDPALGGRLGADLEATVARSRAVTLEEVDSRSLPVRLRDGVAKLFSPYL
jgi:cardiolipin synthase A/B